MPCKQLIDSAENDFSPSQSVLDTSNATDVDVVPENFEAESELS